MPDLSMTNSDALPGPRRFTRAMLNPHKKNFFSPSLTFDPDRDSPLHSRAPTMYNPSSETGIDMSAPTSQEGAPSLSTSAIAIDGSALPSRNRLLKNYEGLGVPAKKVKLDWQHHDTKEMEQVVEEQAHNDGMKEGGLEVAVEEEASSRMVAQGRVIAIDFDKFCQLPTASDYHQYAEVPQSDIEPVDHLAAAEMVLQHTPPAFAQALQALHALNYPVHLITARAEQDRPVMIEWLARQGITVGFSDEDTVLAAWLTNGFALDKTIASRAEGLDDEECKTVGTRENAQRKIKVLQAINACILIDSSSDCEVTERVQKAIPALQCVLIHGYMGSSGLTSPVLPEASDPASAREGVQQVGSWEAAVTCIKEMSRDSSPVTLSQSHIVQ